MPIVEGYDMLFELLVALSTLSPVQVTVYTGTPNVGYNVFGLYRPSAVPKAVMSKGATTIIVSK